MNTLLILLLVIVPLLRFVLFPARAMGRGGGWTVFGAVAILGAMLVIFLVVQTVVKPPGASSAPTATAQAQGSDPAAADIEALKKFTSKASKLGL